MDIFPNELQSKSSFPFHWFTHPTNLLWEATWYSLKNILTSLQFLQINGKEVHNSELFSIPKHHGGDLEGVIIPKI